MKKGGGEPQLKPSDVRYSSPCHMILQTEDISWNFCLTAFPQNLGIKPASEVLETLPGEDLLDLRAVINL